MTSYLAHHTKKMQILARKEAALRRLLVAGATLEKLVSAAIAIREARIRVLQVQRSLIIPKGDHAELYTKIDREIEEVSNTSTASILAEFTYSG